MLISEIIEELQSLSISDLEEISLLVKELLINKKQEQITDNYKESLDEYKTEDLSFSPEVQKLDLILI
jgi:hypothetical protein